MHPNIQLMQMSLAVKSPAAAAAVVAQELLHHSAVLLNYLLQGMECISLCCRFSSHCLPEAAVGLPDEWRRIGVGEDHVAENGVLAFMAVDAFGVVDTGLVERAIVLGAGVWSSGGR